MVAEVMSRSMPPGKESDKEVADWTKLRISAFNLSKYLNNDEKALAYIKIGTQKIGRMTNNNFDNFAIVQAEYGYMCKDLMDTPQKQWDYWVQQETQSSTQPHPAPKAAP